MFQELCTFYKALKPHFSESQAKEVEDALGICSDLDGDTLAAVRTLSMATASVGREEIKKAIDSVGSSRWPSISQREKESEQ